MKILSDNLWKRHILAAFAGLLLAAAFPEISIPALAWIAPALMLLAAVGRRGGEVFRLGYTAGLAHSIASLYWLLLIPVKWFPVLGWVTLSAYLALYPALWLWLVAGKIGEGNWARRTRMSLAGAAVWVALEMLRARLFGGFPWNLVGASQFEMLPLIQIAAWTGIYGVSFLIVWTSLSIFSAFRQALRQPDTRYVWLGETILPVTVVIALAIFGDARLRREGSHSGPTLRVTFVQPSIPQTLIWNSGEDRNRFRQLLQLTRSALKNETDLLLWPEAALPNVAQDDLITLADMVRSNHVWMILGADDVKLRPGTLNSTNVDYFNASILLNPQGETRGVYHKRKLVMFGEYVPFTRWLPFVKYFTPITGGFTPGKKPATFAVTTLRSRGGMSHSGINISTLICFEDIFPDFVREYAGDDTDLLVNLTNNGWFGEGAAQWQHAASAVFRAVENGLPLLRCSNNGLTCWVDANGGLRQVFTDKSGDIHGAGVMTARIPLPSKKRGQTFYNKHGDWLGWGCVAIAALALLKRMPLPKRRKWGDV